MSTWPLKSDEDLLAAASRLFDYTEEGEQQIRAELARRGLPEPPPPVGRCATCGRSIPPNHPAGDCLQCGKAFDSAVQHVLAARAAPQTELPQALQMDTTRLGGWLLLVVVGLAGSVAMSVVALVSTVNVFPTIVANGYGGIVGFAIAVDLAVIVFTVVALVRLNGLRRDAPRLTMILLVARPLAIALVGLAALAVDAELMAEGVGGDIFRSGVYAAIWVPYFQKSVRVKLTFVR